MSAQSSQWSISGSIKVEGTPAISAHKASNAIGFFTSVRKAQSFWRLRRQTGHRQIETKRSIIERQKDGRHSEYYPSTKAGQVHAAPTTCAPCAARARAVSTPRPAETPVTSTRLPVKSTPRSTSSVVDVGPNVWDMVVTPRCCRLPYRSTPEKWSNGKWREPPFNIRRVPPLCKAFLGRGGYK